MRQSPRDGTGILPQSDSGDRRQEIFWGVVILTLSMTLSGQPDGDGDRGFGQILLPRGKQDLEGLRESWRIFYKGTE